MDIDHDRLHWRSFGGMPLAEQQKFKNEGASSSVQKTLSPLNASPTACHCCSPTRVTQRFRAANLFAPTTNTTSTRLSERKQMRLIDAPIIYRQRGRGRIQGGEVENHASQITALPPGRVVRLRRQRGLPFLPRRARAQSTPAVSEAAWRGAGQQHHRRRAAAERSAFRQAHPAGEPALLQSAAPAGGWAAGPRRAVRRGAADQAGGSRATPSSGRATTICHGAALGRAQLRGLQHRRRPRHQFDRDATRQGRRRPDRGRRWRAVRTHARSAARGRRREDVTPSPMAAAPASGSAPI